MTEHDPSTGDRWQLDIALASEVHEQLSRHTTDVYVRTARDTYATLLAEESQWNHLEGSRWHYEMRDAHLGLLMIGVDQDDDQIAAGALRLLSRPADKWDAAVWTMRQGMGIFVNDWSEDLEQAKEEAFAMGSKEAYRVSLARLEVTLLQAGLRRRQHQEHLDDILADINQLLGDTDAFPLNALDPFHNPDAYRLETARLLRDYGENDFAHILRQQVDPTGPLKADLNSYDVETQQRRAKGFGAFMSRIAHPNMPPRTVETSSEERAIEPMRPIVKEGGQAALLHQLLRIGNIQHIQEVYEQTFVQDIRRGGSPNCHRGAQIQAAAFMSRAGYNRISLEQGLTFTARFDELPTDVADQYDDLRNTEGQAPIESADSLPEHARGATLRLYEATHTMLDPEMRTRAQAALIDYAHQEGLNALDWDIEQRFVESFCVWLQMMPEEYQLASFVHAQRTSAAALRMKLELRVQTERLTREQYRNPMPLSIDAQTIERILDWQGPLL